MYTYDALNRVLSVGDTTNTYNGDGVLVQQGTTRYVHDLAAPLSQILSDASTGPSTGSGGTSAQAGTNRYVYGAPTELSKGRASGYIEKRCIVVHPCALGGRSGVRPPKERPLRPCRFSGILCVGGRQPVNVLCPETVGQIGPGPPSRYAFEAVYDPFPSRTRCKVLPSIPLSRPLLMKGSSHAQHARDHPRY